MDRFVSAPGKKRNKKIEKENKTQNYKCQRPSSSREKARSESTRPDN